ncbi:MAG: tyrosine recombinase XerC [Ruminococcaceae bacterium]|nr:tyrosine recombinase XerC [Oscillospiraceae bacterium]
MSDAYNTKDYPELIRKFCSYKAGIQGRSPKTVNEYMLDLRTFCRYMYALKNSIAHDPASLEKIDISDLDTDFFSSVTPEEIYDFIYYTKSERGNGTAARARKLSAIKSFYKYHTQKTRILQTNPAADIEGPKKPKELPKYLSVEESLELLETIKNDTSNPYRTRDFAMITLFLNCGMRLSELAGIKMTDIDPKMASLRVLGKGSKERIIYLNSSCKDAIETYLPDRLVLRKEGGEDYHLFLSRLGKGISVKTVQHVVKKYLAAAGLENKHYSTHKLRHTAATLMYQTGDVDIRVLKDILGHEQLNTTQIYTHVSNKSMEEAMEKNPLSGVRSPEKDNLPPKSENNDD